MIKARRTSPTAIEQDAPKGFDDFRVTLGDTMRGERATLGKSLLDVQRELRIKATYIAAIENGDSDAFETPGFIAGYVRSYARYLGLDPDWAFETFCSEAGFTPAHGMSASASGKRPASLAAPSSPGVDIFSTDDGPYSGGGLDVLGRIEFGAVASVAVLAAVVGAIGWGGWSVLQEVQRVQLAPVNAAPGVVTEIDPLAPAGTVLAEADTASPAPDAPSAQAADRLYRPRALEVPVLVARDGPIAALDPATTGVLGGRGMPARAPQVASVTEREEAAPAAVPVLAEAAEDAAPVVPDVSSAIDDAVMAALAEAGIGQPAAVEGAEMPRVTSEAPGTVELVAVRPSWVRVRAADGSVIFEKVMDSGERFELPATEEAATLRTGNAGGIYFAVGGATYGPAGDGGSVVSDVALGAGDLTGAFPVADLAVDTDLARVVAVAQVQTD